MQCKKLRQVFVPPPPGWRDAAKGVAETAAVSSSGGSSVGEAASAAGGGGADGDDGSSDDELEYPCLICLDHEDGAFVDGKDAGMCLACGQSYCGACNFGGLADQSPNCPTCRAPFDVLEEENFKRAWKLVHNRSPGHRLLHRIQQPARHC